MPDSFPYFAGVLASYFVRVAAAYAVCWLLSSMSPNPRRRFLVWLFYLVGAAGYWVVMFLPASVPSSVSTAVQSLPVHGAAVAPHMLFFPASWAPSLALLAPIIAAAYLLGVLLFLGNMLWQHFVLRRALRHAIEPSRDLGLLFEQMCRGFGLRRCQLLILPQLSSPATAGWLRPCILLPEICEEFNDSSQLADVLYHELIHVSRRDYLWGSVSDLVRGLLFFHPAVWRARQHMRVQRELACDVAVVSERPEHRADYAQSLTRFARLRMLRPGRSVGVDFSASASILGIRVRAVLSHGPQRSWWRAALRSGLSLTLLVSFGMLWPVLGIAAEFAPAQVAQTVAASIAVHARRHMRTRIAATSRVALPPQMESQPAQTLILPPVANEASAPSTLASSESGPQSDDLNRPEDSPVSQNTDPTWNETLPLPRSSTSVANIVQRVATGLAQIGRQETGREAHDRNGHW